MRFGATSSDNVIPYLFWKGNIHEMVAVDVAQLTFSQTKFRPAKPMRMRRYTWPAQNGFMNFLPCAIDCHKTCASQSCLSHEVIENGEVILAVSSLDGCLKEFIEGLWHRTFNSAFLAKLEQVLKRPVV